MKDLTEGSVTKHHVARAGTDDPLFFKRRHRDSIRQRLPPHRRFQFRCCRNRFTSSSMFQGLGNTAPPLLNSASRLILFVLPALWLSRTPGFDIKLVWYLSVGSQLPPACMNLLLLRRELQKKLRFDDGADFVPATAS
jgi:hypothetical protein